MIAALYVERGKRKPVADRLAQRLVKDDTTGCLLWRGSLNEKGYGQIAVEPGKPGLTHRVAWEIYRGPIPNGLCVLHRCDIPACCNPEHLFLGTKADNNADMIAKGRARQGVRQSQKTHCVHGHPLSGENLRIHDGRRFCRTCARLWMQRKRAQS